MTNEQKPRQFDLHYSGLAGFWQVRNYNNYHYEDDQYCKVIEYQAYQALEEKIKELEKENEKLTAHVKAVHEKSIAYGKNGMDMFAHTKLRDEYKEMMGIK